MVGWGDGVCVAYLCVRDCICNYRGSGRTWTCGRVYVCTCVSAEKRERVCVCVGTLKSGGSDVVDSIDA